MDTRIGILVMFCVWLSFVSAEEKAVNEVEQAGTDNNQKTYSFIIPQEDRVRLTFVDKSELGKLEDLHTNLLNLYQNVLEKVLKMNELESKVNVLYEKFAQVGDLGKQVQGINSQLKETNDSSVDKNNKHELKQEQLDPSHKKDEMSELTEHVKKLSGRIEIQKDMLRTQNEKTSQISMDLVKLQDTTESQELRLQTHKNTMEVLSSQIRELDSSVNLRVAERQLSETNSSSGQIDSLSQKVVILQEEVEDLLNTYQKSSPKLTEIETGIKTCSQKTSNMEEKFDSLGQSFADLEKSFLSLPKSSSSMDSGLHKKLDMLEKRLATVTFAINKVNQTCSAGFVNSITFNKQIDNISIEVERYKKVFNKHYENLRNFQAHQKDMIGRYEKNKLERDELRDRIVSSERMMIDLKTKLESHIITCSDLPIKESLRREYVEVTTEHPQPEHEPSIPLTTQDLLDNSPTQEDKSSGVDEVTTGSSNVQRLATRKGRTQRSDHQGDAAVTNKADTISNNSSSWTTFTPDKPLTDENAPTLPKEHDPPAAISIRLTPGYNHVQENNDTYNGVSQSVTVAADVVTSEADSVTEVSTEFWSHVPKKKGPLSPNCTISTIDNGRAIRVIKKKFTGAWMQDSGQEDPRIWVIPDNVKVKWVSEYANVKALEQGNVTRSGKLPFKCGGTGHVMYKGKFYCNRARSNRLIKYNYDQAEKKNGDQSHSQYSHRIKQAGHSSTFNYINAGYTDIDFATDEQGIWLIFGSKKHNGKLTVAQLNADTLHLEKKWVTGFNKTEAEESFMICGVLYVVSSIGHDVNKIVYAFDTNSGKKIDPPDVSLAHDPHVMLDYNPITRKLYGWLVSDSYDGILVTYDIRFGVH